MTWYKLHSASYDYISFGEWSKEKPSFGQPKGKWKTKVENDGRTSADGEHWWELKILIKNLNELEQFIKDNGLIIMSESEIQIYDDYVE